MKRSPVCLYCGKAGGLTREHIVPEALGATRRIRCVCSTCNNEVLSNLDKELAERSPLSLVATAELLKNTGYTWDVDHSERHLLLEARVDEPTQSMTVWPQLIFDDAGYQIRGDHEQVQAFGAEHFQEVFIRNLLAAFQTVKRGMKRPRIIFERVPERMSAMYRYPPRIFANRPIVAFDNRMHFRCRYKTSRDRRYALHALDKWDSAKRFGGYVARLGSPRPSFHLHYDAVAVLRSLVKISLNLLWFVCEHTPVDREHFANAVQMVMGERRVARRLFDRNGFVDAVSNAVLECPKDSHCFRLVHDSGWWNVHFAFFGGRIGAFVHFPGPNSENWRTADVVAPIQSSNWHVRTFRLLLSLTPSIEWRDLNRMIPSLPLTNVQSGMIDVP